MRAGFLDHRSTEFLDLILWQLSRQELVDDDDFLALLLGKLRPAALIVHAGGFLALLDHLGEDLQDLVVANRILAQATVGDVTILDRSLDQPHG
ncbi:hypothetical protein D3C71_1605000 [compost metagenome]